jgi:YlmC/YmxH family sporulation protein
MLKISDLRTREVINVVDGKRLGEIKDIELDLELGKVKSIIIPGSNKIFKFFGRQEDIVISWEQIVKLGVDVILVNMQTFTDPKHNSE